MAFWLFINQHQSIIYTSDAHRNLTPGKFLIQRLQNAFIKENKVNPIKKPISMHKIQVCMLFGHSF